MKILNPATSAIVAEVAEDGAASVRAKYLRARAAQPAWAAVPVKQRLEAIRRFRDRVTQTQEKLAQTLTREVGKPIKQSRNELNGCSGASTFPNEAARVPREKSLRRRQAKNSRSGFRTSR